MSSTKAKSIFEIDQPEEYKHLFLNTVSEVRAYLRSIETHHTMVTVYIDHGFHFFQTPVIELNQENGTFMLDEPNITEAKEAMTRAAQLTLVALLDKVKIQIRCTEFKPVTQEGRPAILVKIPDKLLRLQRREFYRLETPVSNRLQCKISRINHDGDSEILLLPVLDISGGGIGLMEQTEMAHNFPEGEIFSDCRLEIPGEGFISINLCVRTRQRVDCRTGKSYLRIGCEFLSLPAARLAQIERYIAKVERERKSKLSGLA